MKSTRLAAAILSLTLAAAALGFGDKYTLLTGVDKGRYPGVSRLVAPVPGPGFPGTFNDGDRLAGTTDVGPTVNFVGLGTPMFQPNQFGSLSMLFKRGSIPAGGSNRVPILGIDFLGGPRLDLDGDLNNGVRSLVPLIGETPAKIPGVKSFMEMEFDTANGVVEFVDVDALGTNEGGPNIQAEIATVVLTVAGTNPDGTRAAPPNPAWDTRIGLLTAFAGTSGTLSSVYAIDDLQVELWYDSIDPASASYDTLGTFQYFANFRGWMIERDPQTGDFPTLAGEGLGSTLWPLVDTSQVNNVFNTAQGLAGGTATIRNGVTADVYTAAGNGGLALADFGGDLGAYLDAVVVPLVGANARRFVYLESAGFGVNNSPDPVFTDTIGYDVVLIGAERTRPALQTNP